MPTREALARAGSDAALRKALKVRPRQLFLYARHFHVVHDTDTDLGPPDDLPTDELVPLEWLDDDEADINLTAGRGQFEFIETTGWGAPTGRRYTIVAIGLEVDCAGVDVLWPVTAERPPDDAPIRHRMIRTILDREYPNGYATVQIAVLVKTVGDKWAAECDARNVRMAPPSWDTVQRATNQRKD
jgi:hypothetical protein